ncbi:protein mono-ADP-ribosyltransferase PARP14-like [Trachinotus anak]|uniref:protein mono-ADP-ribosyltransferase PARP14-like n=1 Tax=Trachinotus anak TaxID=443729 RepID=UPI0039F19090
MDDIRHYPVFFECRVLLAEERKGIEKYFRIRRRSGGGDCGPLRSVRDQVCSIAFRYQKDQQKVLQKREHVVELAGGPLAFTVRATLDPHTPAAAQSIPASTPPSSGEEYELRPDVYLLRYLKECPEAGEELEKELASLACSAQLYPEERRVLVKNLAQPGAVEKGRNWRAEVDKLFDAYLCHYEVNPHKVKALLQSCSSRQTTDDVKVYSEGGLAVVVGKRSQVNARLIDIEASILKCQGSYLSEMKTSIRRLGEAKLRLLWEEIQHGLRQKFPGVKVTQGDAGQVVLEGSVEDILEAGDWVSDKENLVLERTLSNMSPHLLAFLRKAYGGPGVLGDFLGVSDEVLLEVQDTELRFFSLSADKLDDAEKALQLEFKEVKIDVPNCSALSSELQKKLKSETKKMNKGKCRAQFVFGSDCTVSLQGHTKEVEELSEAVTQFIFQSTVRLPFPELAQELPEFLQQHGFDFSGVTFHPITTSLGPMVVLEGPSSKVTEVRNRLDPFLDSHFKDRITTDLLPSLSLSERSILVASYTLCDELQVLVCQGDITKQDADALVNAANEDLDHCGGVAAALSKAGGPEVQRESDTLVQYIGKIPTGDVVVTTGGKLHCKKLLHAVGPAAGRAGGREKFLLEKTVQSALNLSEIMEFKSIAMPCISSGVFGVPVTVCSEAIVTAVKKFGSQGGRSLSRIILIDNREEVVRAMQEACDRLLLGISSGNTTQKDDLGFLMEAAAQNTAKKASAGAPGDSVHIEVVQGTIETQEVDVLVSPMVGHNLFSTRVGNTLSEKVGSQLTARFRNAAGEDTLPGDAVLVEGLPGLPSNAVFFLNLAPWDNDQDGTAVEVLRLGINTILTSCESRGFGSVAFPVLGAGIALRFPTSIVASVLRQEIHAFKQNRVSRTPFLVRITIHPNDTEASEVFKEFTKDIQQPDQASTTKRIVLLGKTGSGKSNLANTIIGEEESFTTNDSPNSGTVKCQAETRSVNGRSITLIDTPGFFDANRSEEDIKPEIMNCITECAPGPHAFLIVLKVDKFTEQEQDVINKILQYFSEDALKYAVIVFTHGDQLPKGKKIQEFVSENKNLSDLVKKCGGRCHVFDNKYWKNKQPNNYRSNLSQVEDLLNTIDKMVMENNGGYYSNKMLQEVEDEINTEEEKIKQSQGNLSQEEARQLAKTNVSNRILIKLAGTATGTLLGAFFGVAALVGLFVTAMKSSKELVNLVKGIPPVARAGATAAVATGGEVVLAAGLAVGAACATAGGVVGGRIGFDAADRAKTPMEAAEMAANDVVDKAKATWNQLSKGRIH